MTQKLCCLCAACALLFVFATANVANAEGVDAPADDCPCGHVAAPCCVNPCYPPVAYRVGLFGVVRPVVYAPAYRPVYLPPRYVYPPYVPYRPACAPYYVW
jgi:hypothetical protein